MNSEDHKIKGEPVNNDRIRELHEQILELKKRWPAHSVSPAMLLRLDELEEELENELRKN